MMEPIISQTFSGVIITSHGDHLIIQRRHPANYTWFRLTSSSTEITYRNYDYSDDQWIPLTEWRVLPYHHRLIIVDDPHVTIIVTPQKMKVIDREHNFQYRWTYHPRISMTEQSLSSSLRPE